MTLVSSIFGFSSSVSYPISLILDIINVALETEFQSKYYSQNDPKIRSNRLALAVRWFEMFPKDCIRVEYANIDRLTRMTMFHL